MGVGSSNLWIQGVLSLSLSPSLSRKKRFVVAPPLSPCSLCLGGHASACKMEIDSMIEKRNRGLLAHRELQSPPPCYETFRVRCRSSDNVSGPSKKGGGTAGMTKRGPSKSRKLDRNHMRNWTDFALFVAVLRCWLLRLLLSCRCDSRITELITEPFQSMAASDI